MSEINDPELLNNYIAALNAGKATCQEASPLSQQTYIPCSAPAVAIVDNGDPGWYFMCSQCSDHNVTNRTGKILYRLPLLVESRSVEEPTG